METNVDFVRNLIFSIFSFGTEVSLVADVVRTNCNHLPVTRFADEIWSTKHLFWGKNEETKTFLGAILKTISWKGLNLFDPKIATRLTYLLSFLRFFYGFTKYFISMIIYTDEPLCKC